MKKCAFLFIISTILVSFGTFAGSREKAWKLHNRLTGVPPKPAVLQTMVSHIEGGRAEEAALLATEHPNFYNVVLKNWVKPWSNREQTSRAELNDYVATVLGVIRDNVPFTQLLSEDILYTVNGTNSNYSYGDNNHYRDAETRGLNLKDNLRPQIQSSVTGLAANAVSGVITTRASGEAFFSAGTNRRVNRFLFMNYLCKDYEALHDVTIPDFRVRRDVERKPGGDSRTYKNKCVGCHAGQDALGGAYAYYDFVGGRLVYTPGIVVTKMNHNVFHPDAFVTVDDNWINLWTTGQNASLGWRGPASGNGVKQIGQMFARTRAFSHCMASKVYQLVCMKEAATSEDKDFVKEMAKNFESNNYNMKEMIINTSIGCVINEDE